MQHLYTTPLNLATSKQSYCNSCLCSCNMKSANVACNVTDLQHHQWTNETSKLIYCNISKSSVQHPTQGNQQKMKHPKKPPSSKWNIMTQIITTPSCLQHLHETTTSARRKRERRRWASAVSAYPSRPLVPSSPPPVWGSSPASLCIGVCQLRMGSMPLPQISRRRERDLAPAGAHPLGLPGQKLTRRLRGEEEGRPAQEEEEVL